MFLYRAKFSSYMGTSINDVPRFLAIFDLPTYLVLLYNVPFLGLFWTPLPTLIWDVINERSLDPVSFHQLVLDGNARNSSSVLKHRRWQLKKKIGTSQVCPFCFIRALTELSVIQFRPTLRFLISACRMKVLNFLIE